LAATSTDKSVVLQVFDLASYKQIWTVGSASSVNQKLSDGTVGQEGPTYSPDGATLYAAINGQNTVMAIDAASGVIGQTWNVGIAPRELNFVGSKLYVS